VPLHIYTAYGDGQPALRIMAIQECSAPTNFWIDALKDAKHEGTIAQKHYTKRFLGKHCRQQVCFLANLGK
jgi:hypothetical protein